MEVFDLDFCFSVAASAAVSFSPFSLPLMSRLPAAPGVLGVFAEPKEANAPEPRPKAEEALAEGEFVLASGEMALKGLDFPCEESPRRRPLLNVRGESVLLLLSLLSLPMDKESLLALIIVSLKTRPLGIYI